MSTPLFKKLGIKDGMKCFVKFPPINYEEFLAPLPKDVQFKSKLSGKFEFIHLFAKDAKTLENEYTLLKNHLNTSGTFWISWLKQSSKIPTDLNRELIRDYGLANGLVDVKVCSINEQWSSLKFVYRLIDRQ
jgi:hypothetical protein